MAAKKHPVTPLEKGMAFFKGQTITLNIPTAAGGGYDIDSRDLVPGLESFLGASINVVDYATGASIPGQDATARAVPNGLTIGLLETASDITLAATGQVGLNFNPSHLTFLGGFPITTGLLIDHTTDPYASFASLKTATTANPVTVCEITDNSSAIQLNLVLEAYGVHFRAVTGYTNSTTEESGWVRGDCQLIFVSDAGLAPYVKGGTGRALATTNAEPSSFVYYSQLVGVPLFKTLLADTKGMSKLEKTADAYAKIALATPTTAFAAPNKVPAAQYLALRAAFKEVLHLQSVKNALEDRGEDAGYVGPGTEKAGYLSANKSTTAAANFSAKNSSNL
jgi:tripartite-type tricarboxylate transporter receptor subunit TctC